MTATVWINDLQTSPGDDPLPETATTLPPTKAQPDWWAKRPVQFLAGLVLIAAVAFAAWPIAAGLGKSDVPAPPTVDGLSIFAVFFVAALAIERLLEPFTLLDTKKEEFKKEEEEKTSDARKEAHTFAAKGVAASAKPENKTDEQKKAEKSLLAWANAKAKTDAWTTYKALLLWTVASIVGALASAVLNLHLLKTAGIHVPTVYLEVLATGLIIGAGTKPLHDLTKLIAAAKTSATTS